MFFELPGDIYCIDANYVRPTLACFYLLHHQGEIAIIETGTANSLDNLQQLMEAKQFAPEQVRYVVPTHVHLDHAGGAGAMMQRFPNASLVVHPKGARHLIDPEKLIAGTIEVYGEEKYRALYGNVEPVDASRVIKADDGLTLDIAGRELLIKDTPGHANHHFCVWDEQTKGWFSGDVFGISYPELRFANGSYVFPATTPVQFNPDALLDSIQLLRSYRPETIYLTHFNRFDDVAAGADRLSRQVEHYRQLALEFKDHENRAKALEQSLLEYSLQQLNEFSLDQDISVYEKVLAMDMRLNADGLDVWLTRSAA